MTETTQTIFERHEVRKTKRQKADFRAYVAGVARKEGYVVREEKGTFGAINLVIGDPTTARVTYTAHYDTCARLPFPNFITPKHFILYLLYQILIVLVVFASAWILEAGVKHTAAALGATSGIAYLAGRLTYVAVLLVECYLIIAGPANPHTANDNTSGVTTVVDLLCAMPSHLRGNVAFILFDMEEAGLIGSSNYASRHKEAMRDKLLINFDCVSDGDTLLFAVRKGAASYMPLLISSFPANEDFRVEVVTKGVFYPSDQVGFPCGVGSAAFRRTAGGILYMNRIHTAKDTVYEEKNVAYLVAGSIRVSEGLALPEQE